MGRFDGRAVGIEKRPRGLDREQPLLIALDRAIPAVIAGHGRDDVHTRSDSLLDVRTGQAFGFRGRSASIEDYDFVGHVSGVVMKLWIITYFGRYHCLSKA